MKKVNNCIDCNNEISRYAIRCKSCANKKELNPMFGKKRKHSEKTKLIMSKKKKGKLSHTWKGGRINDGYGYILIYKPSHPYHNNLGYVREHRLVVEKELGRYLKKYEIVHHVNGIRNDNRNENLKLFSDSFEHTCYHYKLNKITKELEKLNEEQLTQLALYFIILTMGEIKNENKMD